MAATVDPLSKVFINRPSKQKTRIKPSFNVNPFKRNRRESSASSISGKTTSIHLGGEQSEFKVTHDSILKPANLPAAAKPASHGQRWSTHTTQGDDGGWSNYFDFYDPNPLPEESDYDFELDGIRGPEGFDQIDEKKVKKVQPKKEPRTVPAKQYDDASHYEAHEFMTDVQVKLPDTKKRPALKRLFRSSRSDGIPVVDTKPKDENKFKSFFTQAVPQDHPPAYSAKDTQQISQDPRELSDLDQALQTAVDGFRQLVRMTVILQPVDNLADALPDYRFLVVIGEVLIIMWILYQVSVVIETIALAIRSICMPLIIIGRIFGYF